MTKVRISLHNIEGIALGHVAELQCAVEQRVEAEEIAEGDVIDGSDGRRWRVSAIERTSVREI